MFMPNKTDVNKWQIFDSDKEKPVYGVIECFNGEKLVATIDMTSDGFTSKEQAEKVKEELEKNFPDKTFHLAYVKQLKDVFSGPHFLEAEELETIKEYISQHTGGGSDNLIP